MLLGGMPSTSCTPLVSHTLAALALTVNTKKSQAFEDVASHTIMRCEVSAHKGIFCNLHETCFRQKDVDKGGYIDRARTYKESQTKDQSM
jgi:hypothetical protein